MVRAFGSVAAAMAVLFVLMSARAWPEEATYDELPSGAASEVARLYYTALSVPGLEAWVDTERVALLDAVTERYRDRLVDRAPLASSSASAILEHLGRLADSEQPELVARTCARYGLLDGPCGWHAGYVRRALVLEEMLVQGQLTLAALETELAGAARPGIDGAL